MSTSFQGRPHNLDNYRRRNLPKNRIVVDDFKVSHYLKKRL
jgi:hypothetical protein